MESETVISADHIQDREEWQKGLYSCGKGMLVLIHSQSRNSPPEKEVSYEQLNTWFK